MDNRNIIGQKNFKYLFSINSICSFIKMLSVSTGKVLASFIHGFWVPTLVSLKRTEIWFLFFPKKK